MAQPDNAKPPHPPHPTPPHPTPPLPSPPTHPPTPIHTRAHTWMTKLWSLILPPCTARSISRIANTVPRPVAASRPSEPCRCTGCAHVVVRARARQGHACCACLCVCVQLGLRKGVLTAQHRSLAGAAAGARKRLCQGSERGTTEKHAWRRSVHDALPGGAVCSAAAHLAGDDARREALVLRVLVKKPRHLARARVHVWCGDVLAGADDLLDGLARGVRAIACDGRDAQGNKPHRRVGSRRVARARSARQRGSTQRAPHAQRSTALI
jgi:hypothetical protein